MHGFNFIKIFCVVIKLKFIKSTYDHLTTMPKNFITKTFSEWNACPNQHNVLDNSIAMKHCGYTLFLHAL